jgi:glycosyltransferase involved in cell wall biosynthesis
MIAAHADLPNTWRRAELRVVALLATYNERRFVGDCIEHLHGQGVETYLIDNCSTDDTVEIAERHRGRGLVGVEVLPRDGFYPWRALLARKQQLARELEADWFIHLDPDEVRLPPAGRGTLAEALAAVDRDGYNAVDFLEFTFIPTREDPDHDHPDYQRTLRTYYPFAPRSPNQLKAWKAHDDVELRAGGHRVAFEGLRIWPEPFPMKHYLFLSIPHAIEKYVERSYDPREVEGGWHGWRAGLSASEIPLPTTAEIRVSRSEYDLDPSDPRKRHYIDRDG